MSASALTCVPDRGAGARLGQRPDLGEPTDLSLSVPGSPLPARLGGLDSALVGGSRAMSEVYEKIERVAPTRASVLLVGESGTGKELVAEAVHRLSRRSSAPFVAVNCGAISPALIESELFGHEKGSFTGAHRRRPGYFQRANGGTLFLDEITEMPPEMQVKLLRALDTHAVRRVGSTDLDEVNIRVISASNQDPGVAMAKGVLRTDLFYRLNVFSIELPPLRHRSGDIALLAEHFLEQLNARDGETRRFTRRAMEHMETLAWPGNVRELRNVVERAAILSDETIDLEVLPRPDPRGGVDRQRSLLQFRVGTALSEVKRRLTLATLDMLDGNKTRTAEMLGISVKTLYNQLKVYEIQEAALQGRADPAEVDLVAGRMSAGGPGCRPWPRG